MSLTDDEKDSREEKYDYIGRHYGNIGGEAVWLDGRVSDSGVQVPTVGVPHLEIQSGMKRGGK